MPIKGGGGKTEGEQIVRVMATSRGAPTHCRSCKRDIVFYTTYPGLKAMPFDGDPLPLKPDEEIGAGIVVRYMPGALNHFATCPQGPQWSRRGSKPTPTPSPAPPLRAPTRGIDPTVFAQATETARRSFSNPGPTDAEIQALADLWQQAVEGWAQQIEEERARPQAPRTGF